MIVHPPTLIRANFVFLYFVFLPFITETLSLKGERQRIIIWLNLISHHRTFGRDGLPLQWVCKDFCKGSRSCHPPSKSSWQTIMTNEWHCCLLRFFALFDLFPYFLSPPQVRFNSLSRGWDGALTLELMRKKEKKGPQSSPMQRMLWNF